MKFIQKFCFTGCSDEAIHFYQEVFGCEIHSIVYYRDAVANGWAPPCPEMNDTIYHSEIYFGDVEIRIADIEGEDNEITLKTDHLVGLDTAEEVEEIFAKLAEGGEIVMPLNRPPYMVIIGSVRDKFGVLWTLMCDFK